MATRPAGSTPTAEVTAIVGATVIDGNGGAPLRNATILIRGRRIIAVGPRASVPVPREARLIAATGKFITPGLITTNYHMTVHPGTRKDEERFADHAAQGVQLALKYGITTVRSSYGFLQPYKQVQAALAQGHLVGARLLISGNIVGWGGPFSRTDPVGMAALAVTTEEWKKHINMLMAQGAGEELQTMSPDSLRGAINAYLDKGLDFVKYGATAHLPFEHSLLFSSQQQAVIVDVAHRRGIPVEVHAGTLEAKHTAVLAGIDLMQHPEIGALDDEVIRLLSERHVICSINWLGVGVVPTGPAVQRLIKGGCITSVALDYALPNENDEHQERFVGNAMVRALEAAVELGMTPGQVIVAATKHGAMASRALPEYGTLEVGKYADLLILDADPLAHIGSFRLLSLVMKEGQVIDRRQLPSRPVYDMEGPTAWYPEDWHYLNKAEATWFGGLVLTDAQRTTLRQLWMKHDTERQVLIDSLRIKGGGNQLMLRLIARQLGAYRAVLAPAQQAMFDPKLRAWMRTRAAEGYDVEIAGIER